MSTSASDNQRQDGNGNGTEDGDDVGGVTLEKKWTHEATNRLIDLIDERKQHILETGIAESTHLHILRFKEFENISDRLQEEGFMYSTASCQKKLNNLKRAYLNCQRVVEDEKAKRIKTGNANSSESIEVNWPYFKRFAEFLDDTVDPLIYVNEVCDGEKYIDTRIRNKRARVSNAVHTILKSEPIIILEDIQNQDKNHSQEPVSDSASDTSPLEVKQEVEDIDLLKGNDNDLIRRLRRRRQRGVGIVDESSSLSPQTKKKRKLLISFKPKLSSAIPNKKQTFSLTSTPSEEIIREVKILRKEVSEINVNLDKLIMSNNRLCENFEKFMKFMARTQK